MSELRVPNSARSLYMVSKWNQQSREVNNQAILALDSRDAQFLAAHGAHPTPFKLLILLRCRSNLSWGNNEIFAQKNCAFAVIKPTSLGSLHI